MPAKVLPGVLDFAWLTSELERLGFRPLTGVEFQKDFLRLALKAPRPRPGREAGFVFTANGLTVKVWTTWLIREGEAREVDAGWVLITDGDRVCYFSRPLHRTKNFVLNLFAQAWIQRWRVLHRPLCPQCRQFMDIVSGRGLKARYWRCSRRHPDQQAVSLDWDHSLPKRARQYVETLRRERRRYEKNRKTEGKPLHLALIRRKAWGGRSNS